VPDAWSDMELDSLWVGVRRHGQGNWEAMLRDPLLFFKGKTVEHLTQRWMKERLQIFNLEEYGNPQVDRHQVAGTTSLSSKDQLSSGEVKIDEPTLLLGGIISDFHCNQGLESNSAEVFNHKQTAFTKIGKGYMQRDKDTFNWKTNCRVNFPFHRK